MSLDLLDWRRRVQALYAEPYGRPPTPPPAHETLAARPRRAVRRPIPTRPCCPTTGPASPALPSRRTTRHCASRSAVETDASRSGIEVPTATDGVVPFDRIGAGRTPDLGSLDVWWLGVLRRRGVRARQGRARRRAATYGGGRYLLDTVKGADLGGDAHGGAWSSTSTSPTTRRAPTTRPGPARWLRPATRSRSRPAPASSTSAAPDRPPRRPPTFAKMITVP